MINNNMLMLINILCILLLASTFNKTKEHRDSQSMHEKQRYELSHNVNSMNLEMYTSALIHLNAGGLTWHEPKKGSKHDAACYPCFDCAAQYNSMYLVISQRLLGRYKRSSERS